jgi:hypothetical protein
MTSKPVAFLLADLGVTKTHSRPHTSNDNPYSQAQFKTLKYRPEFPDRFGSIEDARALANLLPLVQQHAPPLRHRPLNAADASLWTSASGDRRQTGRAIDCLRRSPRTLR